MSSIVASFLRLPRWLERAWQDTVTDPAAPKPQQPDPLEAETTPLPLQGWLDRRR